jgi:hypothetical protein
VGNPIRVRVKYHSTSVSGVLPEAREDIVRSEEDFLAKFSVYVLLAFTLSRVLGASFGKEL